MKRHAVKLGLFLSLVSSSALAAGWSTATNVKITQVEIDTTSTTLGFATYIGFSTMPNNRPTCATGPQAIITGSAEHVKMMTNVATAAFLAGKTVRVFWTGQCTNSTYGQITQILFE